MAVFTSGKVFTDGFCSGVYAAHIGCPMLLVNKCNTDAAKGYVVDKKIIFGIVVGSETVIDNITANSLFGVENAKIN